MGSSSSSAKRAPDPLDLIDLSSLQNKAKVARTRVSSPVGIGESTAQRPEEATVMREKKKPSTKEVVLDALLQLGTVQRSIVCRSFGIEDGHPRSPEELAAEDGGCPVKIREIEEQALRELMGYHRRRDRA